MLGTAALSAEEKLLFFHIPKTGGVTVSYLLEKHFSVPEMNHQNPLLISYGSHYCLYGFKNQHKNYKMITFLRDPVSRVLSEQRYCMEKHGASAHFLSMHFLPTEGDPIETAQNVVCKILSGLDPNDESIPIEQHLEAAKFNLLHHFFFVGITEHLEESIDLLYASLKWPLNNEFPRFNTTVKTKSCYPDDVIALIKKQNWADIELYQFALSLYQERKEKIIRQPREIAYDFAPSIGSSKLLAYNFDLPLDGKGWIMREFLSDGRAYRWLSLNNRATLCFHLTPSSYCLDFRVLLPHLFIKNFYLTVNGQEVPVHFQVDHNSQTGDGFIWAFAKAKISQELIPANQKTEIAFQMKEPDDPKMRDLYAKTKYTERERPNLDRGKCAIRSICFMKE